MSKLETYDKNMLSCTTSDETYNYYDIKQAPFKIEGLAWFEKEKEYFRIPKNCKEEVGEAVYWLASHPAGAQVRFKTNSKTISIKVKLADKANMSHMTAVGQTGFDLYHKDLEEKQYRFFASSNYPFGQYEYNVVLYRSDFSKLKDFILNFPLYMGVKEVLVGIEKDAILQSPNMHELPKKVVVYGTSITQGGCATRPGMAYTNILSRKLDTEFINLGFSGSGLGEPIVAKLICEIKDVSLIILDYEANGGCTGHLEKYMDEFVQILRNTFKEIPILIMTKPPFSNYIYIQKEVEERKRIFKFQKNLVNRLRKNGDKNIYFLDGNKLFGKEDIDECMVDGIHPTDLGFYKMSKTLYPVLKKLLENKKG